VIERDEKLRRKFASAAACSSQSSSPVRGSSPVMVEKHSEDFMTLEHDDDDDHVVIDEDNKADEEDWQNVPSHNSIGASMNHPPTTTPTTEDEANFSLLGSKLAEISVSVLARENVLVSNYVSAIAVILHAALTRSDNILDFQCTGVPPKSKSASNGFAPPIRELPKNVFLPVGWDKHSNGSVDPIVSLRYRNEGLGSLVLSVAMDNSTESDDDEIITGELNEESQQRVTIRFGPNGKENHEEENSKVLRFPLGLHMNVSSFTKARETNSRILPTLHYKALSVLFANFCTMFDIGDVTLGEDQVHNEKMVVVDGAEGSSRMSHGVDAAVPSPMSLQPPGGRIRMDNDTNTNNHLPRTIDDAFPTPNIGDFNGDLAPAGIPDLRAGNRGNNNEGGMLMGPNHPMFHGGGGIHRNINYFDDDHEGMTGPPRIGGLGMQPRYDPVGPPGGPTDPNFIDPNGGRGRGGGRFGGRGRGGARRGNGRGRGGLGDPNPDHQRPPSDFGGGMFL